MGITSLESFTYLVNSFYFLVTQITQASSYLLTINTEKEEITFSGVYHKIWWFCLHKASINDQGGTLDAKFSASLEKGAAPSFSPLHSGSASSVGNSPTCSLVTIDFYHYKAHTFLIVVRKMP